MNGLSKICFAVLLLCGLTGCATTHGVKWDKAPEIVTGTAVPSVHIDNSITVEPIHVTVDTITPVVDLFLAKAEREHVKDIKKMDLSETECLTKAMYYEARGEGMRGMRAVAFVIYNRVLSDRFPDTFCGVVLQKGQFSFVRDGHPEIISEWGIYKKALAMAVNLVQNGGFQRIKSPVGKALFFDSYPTRARWARPGVGDFVATIGNHNFFK